MKITAQKINTFTMFKLPSAFICGVRVKYLDDEKCVVSVKHNWLNKNPFRSMFWAVQGMAAELATGALVIKKIRESGQSISMLVANNNATFTKKATGRITFACKNGNQLDQVIDQAIATGEGQTIWMSATGVNEQDIVVSTFNFEWTLKLKNK